jgi:hypothetical protein
VNERERENMQGIRLFSKQLHVVEIKELPKHLEPFPENQ